ncbi:hypothetical protein ACQYWQ_18105 [Streptomyces sp. P6-2-1]|uniref:hypothetical protein n=1 Tax=Streptomyces sp. P6-2-1 TaxID=3422591 RepID=UPI003D3674D4
MGTGETVLGPGTSGFDAWTDGLEGVVVAGLVAAAGWWGAGKWDLAWLKAAGAAGCVLVLAGVVALVRSALRGAERVRAGASRARAAAEGARWCGPCGKVYVPGNEAPLSAAQFRHLVWTAGGYGDLLDAEAKAAPPP